EVRSAAGMIAVKMREKYQLQPLGGEAQLSHTLDNNALCILRRELHHCGRRNLLGAGDMVLADSARPSRLVFKETTHIITVRIPAPLLKSHLAWPERLCNRPLCRSHDFTKGLRSTLVSLLRMGEKGMSKELQESSIQPFLGLLSFAFVANHGACLEKKPAAGDRIAHICRYIDDNLADARLGPESIAARFRLSQRYVRKL